MKTYAIIRFEREPEQWDAEKALAMVNGARILRDKLVRHLRHEAEVAARSNSYRVLKRDKEAALIRAAELRRVADFLEKEMLIQDKPNDTELTATFI